MKQLPKLGGFTNWRALILEVVSIIIGVLIALAMDEWNENRQNTNKAIKAVDNIKLELASNLRVLDIIHPGNKLSLETFQDEKIRNVDSLTILPGLQLQETAWNTFLRTGVSAFIPYEDLYKIAELYNMIQIYKEVGNRFIDTLTESRTLHSALGREIEDAAIIRENLSVLAMMVSIETNLMNFTKTYLESESTTD